MQRPSVGEGERQRGRPHKDPEGKGKKKGGGVKKTWRSPAWWSVTLDPGGPGFQPWSGQVPSMGHAGGYEDYQRGRKSWDKREAWI